MTAATAVYPVKLAVTGNNLVTLEAVASFFNWEITSERDLVEFACFGATAFQNKGLMTRWTASADKFWEDERYTVTTATAPNPGGEGAIMMFFVNHGDIERYVGTVLLNDINIATPVDGLVTSRMNVTGETAASDETLYYRNSSQ
jgi:hypothetical protein